jgi:Cu-processing system permease protein
MGVGIPILLFAPNAAGFALLFTGAALTLIFTSIAFLAAVCSRDKARGIGIALLIWFYFAMLYDGLLLLLLNSFSDYPMEKFTLLLSSLNPIDLGRIFIMLQLDISALMGYTGAVYKDFFGSASGMLFTTGIMLLWMAIPLWLALRLFRKKDL